MPAAPPRIRGWLWSTCRFLADRCVDLRLRLTVRVEGDVPARPVVVCAKHGSAFDIAMLASRVRGLTGQRPYFQMGAFVGYRILGRMRPILNALGGFPVMRPKEVRRLSRRPGEDRRSAMARMREINTAAEDVRREVLRRGGVLVVFPEGTRDDGAVRPLVSELEVRSALAVTAGGLTVRFWPVTIAYGRRRWWRRRAVMTFHAPFAATPGDEATEVLAQVAAAIAEGWRPPDLIDAGR